MTSERERLTEGANDFSRITLRSNIETILRTYQDINPHMLTDKIMSAIPRISQPTTEPVDDAALIAEAYRNTAHTASDTVFGLEILRLERTGWQPPAPEPDRAEALACELWKLGETPILGEKEAIIRRHFDELRVEWEAERQQAMEARPAPEPVDPAIEWTRKVLAAREAPSDTATRLNILKGVHDDKFWFERALAVVREALSEAERPVIDVPDDVREGIAYYYEHPSRPKAVALARFVKQLIDGAGVHTKGPSQ